MLFFKRIFNYIFVKIKNRTLKSLSISISRKAIYGKYVRLNENVIIESGVNIGSYSYVNNNSNIISGSIGNYCSISYNVLIGPDEHPLNEKTTSPYAYNRFNIKYIQNAPPVIGNDVWIGANVVILRGVTIGNGAVIGAGCIVTRNVDDFEIVGGVPCHTIRYRKSVDLGWCDE